MSYLLIPKPPLLGSPVGAPGSFCSESAHHRMLVSRRALVQAQSWAVLSTFIDTNSAAWLHHTSFIPKFNWQQQKWMAPTAINMSNEERERVERAAALVHKAGSSLAQVSIRGIFWHRRFFTIMLLRWLLTYSSGPHTNPRINIRIINGLAHRNSL